MTQKAAFTSEEWDLLRLVPPLVSAGMSSADHSGLFATVKEASAGMRSMLQAYQGSDTELLQGFANDHSTPGIPDPRELLGDGDREQQRLNLKAAVMSRLQQALSLLEQKSTPEETRAYKQMLHYVAESVANASKEGGFLGFGGVRVSEAERSFLAELDRELGLVLDA
jgi:hypothetical protein